MAHLDYGILINGNLAFATNPLKIDRSFVYTTEPTPYGYKPVVYTDPPQQEGYYAVPDGWEETETEIIQKWRLEPEPDEAMPEDYEAALHQLGVNI